ncbi:alpha-L-iduronidase-like [Haliotis rufescens]|uniref:alpha-L-iduronidase-like n=1 Tax=Haliotis rufescens TaxID=6454 RepID=UPI00201E8088|nr:alpha-L-iduronidase-like [Haliotis rufescens]
MMLWTIISFLLSLLGRNSWGQGNYGFTLNSWDVIGDLNHFWKSTGFCPPLPHSDAAKFDLSPDMQQNLAYIGAMPHRGIEQVRIHWLLELIKVTSINNGNATYDFTDLDSLMDLLYVNGLKPGFEIMGNPSNLYTDLEHKTQVYMWRDMVQTIAQRYISKYGLDYVKTWNWETWNEPDCGDFDNLKFTVQGFLNYYDACSEGLKAADPSLILGGPGSSRNSITSGTPRSNKKYAENLLDHVISGRNYFTGEKGVRIDFISLHRKGDSHAANITNAEVHSVAVLRKRYPGLANKPFFNDEADPLVGWSRPEQWRGTSRYAAFVAKVIAQHQNIIIRNQTGHINYQLLSNDNGFLSYYPNQFTQRTLLARFQMNNTSPPHVAFVRKPVYAAMAMLSLLGDQQVSLDSGGFSCVTLASVCGLASLHQPAADHNSSDSWQSALLIYNNNDVDDGNWGILNVDWNIRPPQGTEELFMVQYGVNWDMGDPMGVWGGLFKAPDFPTVSQFKSIRQQQGPVKWTSYPVSANVSQVPIPPMFQLLTDNVLLMHLCAKSKYPPEQVTGLRFINITSGQILVVWSDDNIKTKCIFTYVVEYSADGSEAGFKRVNEEDTIVTAVVIAPQPNPATGYIGDKMVTGSYRVKAVDYFKRPGPYSQTQIYK